MKFNDDIRTMRSTNNQQGSVTMFFIFCICCSCGFKCIREIAREIGKCWDRCKHRSISNMFTIRQRESPEANNNNN